MIDTPQRSSAASPGSAGPPPRIPILAFGLSLGIFLAISYALCVLLYLLFPDLGSGHAVLSLFLPWFKPLTWTSFLGGLALVFLYGWYVALGFGSLFNLLAARFR